MKKKKGKDAVKKSGGNRKKAVQVEKKVRGLGIGVFMAECLRAGKDTKTVLDEVHKKFPQSKATGKDVSIIRGKVNKGIL